MQGRDDLWAALLEELRVRSWAHEQRDDRLVLRLPQRPHETIDVLITPEQWAEMVGTAFGEVRAALVAFTHTVETLPLQETRLYYESYAVVRGVDLEPAFFHTRPSGKSVKRVFAFPPSVDDT